MLKSAVFSMMLIVVLLLVSLVAYAGSANPNEMIPINAPHPILIAKPVDVSSPNAISMIAVGLLLMLVGRRTRKRMR